MKVITNDSVETFNLGKRLLEIYPGFKLILVEGEMGAGKTTFIKGISEYFGSDSRSVNSPTFNFKTNYDYFIHYDLYLLDDTNKSEVSSMLLEDISNETVIVEWPKKIKKLLKMKNFLYVLIKKTDDNKRLIKITKY